MFCISFGNHSKGSSSQSALLHRPSHHRKPGIVSAFTQSIFMEMHHQHVMSFRSPRQRSSYRRVWLSTMWYVLTVNLMRDTADTHLFRQEKYFSYTYPCTRLSCCHGYWEDTGFQEYFCVSRTWKPHPVQQTSKIGPWLLTILPQLSYCWLDIEVSHSSSHGWECIFVRPPNSFTPENTITFSDIYATWSYSNFG